MPGELITRLLKQARATVPFDWYLAVGRPFRGLGSDSGFMLGCSCSDEVREAYFQPDWPKSDPHIRALLSLGRVVTTAEVRAAAQAIPGMMDRLAILEQSVGREVVAVPIGYCRRDGGFVLFRRDQPFSPAEAEFLALVAPAIHGAASERRVANLDDLTRRERECLTWASRGKTAEEIGDILGISKHTAVAHLNSSMAKLKVSSRAHAVAQALRLGIIE
jgi:DNA-binding CsgD family transcriptional regulator